MTRLLAAALVFALAGPAAAQPPEGGKRKDRAAQPLSPDVLTSRLVAPFQPVVAKVNESTVRVLADGKDAALGTVVFADGYVLTKASELKGDVAVKFHDGSKVTAKLVGVHKATDLALLKIEKKGLTALSFADSKVAALGNWLAAAGVGSDPAGVGIVSVVTRSFSKLEQSEFMNPNRGFLGIQMKLGGATGGGAEIDIVTKGGAADKAGLKKGDIVRTVDGLDIPDSDALRGMLNEYRPGQRVALGITRGGEKLDLTATLLGPTADMKGAQRSDMQNTMGGSLSVRRGGFERVLQTDMVVEPKNCGGCVVDLDGRVIGVCIARAGRVETYILPGEVVRPLLAELRAGKYPPPVPPAPLPVAPAPRPVGAK